MISHVASVERIALAEMDASQTVHNVAEVPESTEIDFLHILFETMGCDGQFIVSGKMAKGLHGVIVFWNKGAGQG